MISILLKPEDALVAGAPLVGGKAIGLARLVSAGAHVPRWAVLSVDAFRTHLRHAGVGDQAAELLRARLRGEIADGTAEALRNTIREHPLGPDVSTAIAEFCCDGEYLAIRSSAAGEDGAEHSFAGVHSSYLYRRGLEQVSEAIKACWASAFSEQALAYRCSSARSNEPIGMGVVIQEMVAGEVSGVLFTHNPVTGSPNESLISACWGLGEGVVNGSCNTDEFRLSHTHRELSATIADKDTMVVRAPTVGTKEVAVPAERRGMRCLTVAQTAKLSRCGLTLAESLNGPQDIEWTICGDQLILLQARPITTLPLSGVGDWKTVWDNSNIQESFNGVTLPLTFSWAAAAYRAIFRETLRLAGIRANRIRNYDPILRNMVGLMSGRVYYNINNWYRIIQLTPSFDRKKEDVEKMIGVENPVEFIADEYLTTREKLGKASSLTLVAIGWTWRICVRRRSIEIFQREVNAELRTLRENCQNAVDLGELLAHADAVLKLFDRWAIPMFNDFFLSIQAGRLRRILERAGTSNVDEVVAGLLAAHEAIESIEPTLQLMRIAARIQSDRRWAEALETGAPLTGLVQLCEQAPEIASDIDGFVELFGDRCIGEQKLETISLRQDRSFLAKILRNYVADPDLNPAELERAQRTRQRRFEADVMAGLPRRRRRQLSRVLHSARNAVRCRESMRLTRTRLIGVARLLYTRVGERLHAASCLDDPRQVFYLTMDEISAFVEGRAVTSRLAELARLRAAEFASYEDEDPPNQFQTLGPPYVGRRSLPTADQHSADNDVLRGVGCCPGVAEAETQIVRSPSDDLNVRGKILVTVRTDPGWGPLFPGLAGLLVERGSTLSHSAVLARELGIPAVVGVPGLMATVTSGEHVRLNGSTGIVLRLNGIDRADACDSRDASGTSTRHASEIDEITERVRELVLLRLELADVDTEVPLLDYGLDSVRGAELIADLEASFGVEIDDEEAANLPTVTSIVAHIALKSALEKLPGR